MNTFYYNKQNQLFLELRFEQENKWIYANWTGYISPESARAGTQALLKLLEQNNCPFLLNDNRLVLGPWDKSNCYIQEEIVPKAYALGLRYMAHVLSPAISGALSAQDLHRRMQNTIDMKLFGEMEKAMTWLQAYQLKIGQTR